MIVSVTVPPIINFNQNSQWFVYILECKEGSLYTGITNNLEKRIEAHNNGLGAKYTKARKPVILRYFEKVANKSLALKREYAIKQLSREKKVAMLKAFNQ